MGNRKVLMIAFHVPPFVGGSSVHRIMSFSRHLKKVGWDPLILTVKPRAYAAVNENNYKNELSTEVKVSRTFAFDISRDFSLYRRYPHFLAIPDRWSSWWFSAIPEALRIIKREKPVIVWSTFPVATSHLIGATLKKVTGLPWVAEFRDPMYFESDDQYRLEKYSKKYLEALTVKKCDRVITVTDGAKELYLARYNVPEDKVTVIENGYDEESIRQAERSYLKQVRRTDDGPLTILHSGGLYPSERDPVYLFKALRMLKDEGEISPRRVRFVFRGCGDEDYFHRIARENKIEDFVKIEPLIPYIDALAECFSVDALMVIQGQQFNNQIPAKIYEYFRIGKPVVGLVDPEGETARILNKMGCESIFPMTSIKTIKNGLKKLVDNLARGEVFVPELSAVTQYSRYSRVCELGKNLDKVYEQSCQKFQRSY